MNDSLRKVGQEESRKQMDQSRAWLLGLSADHFDRDYVVKALSSYRYVGQMEIGKMNGYEHWQIFIDNPSRRLQRAKFGMCQDIGDVSVSGHR